MYLSKRKRDSLGRREDENVYLPLLQREVGLHMSKPVLIDFYADWCGPCKRQSPMIDELATRMGDKVDIRKINVDEHMDEAERYGIQVVPTLIIEKDGRVVQTLEGLTTAQTLEILLQPLVEE